MSDEKQYPNSRIVQTAQGKVQGRRLIYEGEKQVDAFQGIPFAAPPIGELRFKKPHPPSAWEGVKETKAFCARPMQPKKYPQDYEVNGVPSEDCLYLNVFTPCWEPPAEGFPVMFFIHGGGFECGEAKAFVDTLICENIVTRGIVFVTIQYRVGYLGFFTTGKIIIVLSAMNSIFTGTAFARETSDFGTKPRHFDGFKRTLVLLLVTRSNNVTVMGQSAGGASADFLHISPHSTGLFHKVIPMAGNADCRWTSYEKMPLHCRNKALRLGIKWSNSEELIEELRNVPAVELGVNIRNREKEDDAFMETVVYQQDGDFFPESFDELRAKAMPKTMMTGVTKEEGLLMMLSMPLNNKTLDYFVSLASHSSKNNAQLADELTHRFDGLAEESDEFGQTLVHLVSDYFFNAGTLELCRKTVEIQKEPVFLYTFEHFNPAVMGFMVDMLPIKDVTHTCELYYFFKTGILGDFRPEINETEQRLIDEFTTAFTNFAKFGNPNGPSTSESELASVWESATRENHEKNYVFGTNSCEMSDQFFGGRPAEFVRIVNTHNGNRPQSSL